MSIVSQNIPGLAYQDETEYSETETKSWSQLIMLIGKQHAYVTDYHSFWNSLFKAVTKCSFLKWSKILSFK